MADSRQDNTLVDKTISRLLDFRGMEVAGITGSKRLPLNAVLDCQKPVEPLVDEVAGQTGWDQTCELPDGPFSPRPVVNPARQRKMMALVPILSIVLLVVLTSETIAT